MDQPQTSQVSTSSTSMLRINGPQRAARQGQVPSDRKFLFATSRQGPKIVSVRALSGALERSKPVPEGGRFVPSSRFWAQTI